jgi:hypothetical protein
MTQAYNKRGFYPVSKNARPIAVDVAASQVIAQGDALILDSGEVSIALAGSARIFGFAAEPATTNASGVRTDELGAKRPGYTKMRVYPATDGEFFEGVADADSSASLPGAEVDLVGATGAQMIDVGASTTDVFKLVAADPGDAPADAYCRWQFVVNKPDLGAID